MPLNAMQKKRKEEKSFLTGQIISWIDADADNEPRFASMVHSKSPSPARTPRCLSGESTHLGPDSPSSGLFAVW